MANNYSYRARDGAGKLSTGTILAENEAGVAAFIRNKGLYVAQIKLLRGQSDLRTLLDNLTQVKTKDLAILCRQFSVMIDAGLALMSSLNILIEQTSNPKLKNAIRTVYVKVQAGETLAGAMAEHPRVFPVIMTSMIAAGEVGGVLDDVLDRLATHFEKEHKMNEKVKSAMAYPLVVLCMAVISVTFILIFVLPTFVGMFAGMNVQLPLLTRILIAVSTFLKEYLLFVTIGLAAGAYGFSILVQRPGVRKIVDSIYLKLPIFGMLSRKIALARFSRTFGTLMRGGVPIIAALEVVKKTTANVGMTQALTSAQISVGNGLGLSGPLASSKMFTPMVVQMIAVGEETGALDKMLDKIADFYESDVDDTVGRLSSLLEPILIGVLGVVIGLVVISIAMPLFDVITNFGAK